VAYRDKYIEGRNVARIVKALSNDYRIAILEMLGEEDTTIQSIMARLKLSKTAVLTHLNSLETAGFISSELVRGSVGNQKLYHKEYDRLIFNFSPGKENEQEEQYYEIAVEIGNYFDFRVYPPCGLAKREHIIDKWDDPSVFFHPDRISARLLWGALGFVEYRIPLNIPFETDGFSRIEIILEASAQGDLPTHRQLRLPASVNRAHLRDGESSLSFSLNGVGIAECTVHEFSRTTTKGGLTGAKGKYTPGWWRGSNYGELLTIIIDGEGTAVNGQKASSVSLSQIFPPGFFAEQGEQSEELRSDAYLSLRIEVKGDAPCIGGFTLYGRGFGNFDQDIIIRFYP
jgi:predicted transcriptional regulator